MPKYRVYAKAVTYYYQDVDACNVNDAMNIAEARPSQFVVDDSNTDSSNPQLDICRAVSIK